MDMLESSHNKYFYPTTKLLHVKILVNGFNYRSYMPNIKQCAAFCCRNTTKDGVSLHSFPSNYSRRWIEAVNKGPDWKPRKTHRLCSDHFPEVRYGKCFIY